MNNKKEIDIRRNFYIKNCKQILKKLCFENFKLPISGKALEDGWPLIGKVISNEACWSSMLAKHFDLVSIHQYVDERNIIIYQKQPMENYLFFSCQESKIRHVGRKLNMFEKYLSRGCFNVFFSNGFVAKP